jgi:hypothetical protein
VLALVTRTLWEQECAQPSNSPSEKPPDPSSTSKEDELLAFLDDQRQKTHLYLVVHNIDGPDLRKPEAQALLGEMARCRGVRMIASVDNVNATLRKLNWGDLFFSSVPFLVVTCLGGIALVENSNSTLHELLAVSLLMMISCIFHGVSFCADAASEQLSFFFFYCLRSACSEKAWQGLWCHLWLPLC